MNKGLVIAFCIGLPAAALLTHFVTAEPAQPQPEAKPITVEQRKDVVRFDNGVTVFLEGDERIEVEAQVLGGQTRLLEFLVVGAGGPVHEALFVAGARARDLHQGLELLGLRCGQKKLRFRGDDQTPDGPAVDIAVQWKDKDGKAESCPVEDWLYDTIDDAKVARGPWTFTGSLSEFRDDLGREIYAADTRDSIVGLWRDPSCVIDNPREHGAIPDVYIPNPEAGLLPPPQTVVTLVFRAHKG
ncbi:MAG: hypothetical protein HUU29_01915 [Planctomycetaceae bacterium]|nr:hypothetical protein [Planctomycetaceae bacterium]